MLKLHCDICGCIIKENDEHTIKIDKEDSKDLCGKCLKKIRNMLDTNADINSYKEEKDDTVEVKKATHKRSTEEQVDSDTKTKYRKESTGYSPKEIDEKVKEALKIYEETCKKQSVRRANRKLTGKKTALDKIEEYGVEKFAKAYLEGTPSVYFEELLGVGKFQIADFVRKYKLQRRERNSKDKKEGD